MGKPNSNYLESKFESKRLATKITNYWKEKGYPEFTAWVEECILGGKKVFVVRSNIKFRSKPNV